MGKSATATVGASFIKNSLDKEVNARSPQADGIKIAVAYMSTAGLKKVGAAIRAGLANEAEVLVIVGTDSHITDPDALQMLFDWQKSHHGLDIYLATGGRGIFHPKVYQVIAGTRTWVAVGSVNLTAGGMGGNSEASIAVECGIKSEYAKNISDYFDSIQKNAERLVVQGQIDRYREHYNIKRRCIVQAEQQAKKEIANTQRIMLPSIAEHYRQYQRDKRQRTELAGKRKNYQQAVLTLEAAASAKSEDRFKAAYESLVGYASGGRLWHSDHMYRKKKKAIADWRRTASIFSWLIANHASAISAVYNHAIELAADCGGVGPNVITEALTTLAPHRYAVLNKNSVSGMHLCGLVDGLHRASQYQGEHYVAFCAHAEWLRSELDMQDLLNVDHFLNYLYWPRPIQG